MQFIYFLMILNVRFPQIIYEFVLWFDISIGDIHELIDLLPAIPRIIIDPDDFPSEFVMFPHQLEIIDIEAPYLILDYWPLILFLLFIVAILVPAAYLCDKYTKR